MQDQLGNRMKEQYEDRTRYLLSRRTYTIIRIDGKAFHTYCKGLNKPFDHNLMDDFATAASYCCEEIQGCVLAYCQSDEVSFLLTDFSKITTDAWFNGDIRKICSVSASMITAKFNQLRKLYMDEVPCLLVGCSEFVEGKCTYLYSKEGRCKYQDEPSHFDSRKNYRLATFDSRAWTIPDRQEVINYLIWRQNDCTRNSILSVAQSLYSHKEMENKNCNELQEMIFQKGKNWNDYTNYEKHGTIIIKEYEDKLDGSSRSYWKHLAPPIFTQKRSFLERIIPYNPNNIIEDISK